MILNGHRVRFDRDANLEPVITIGCKVFPISEMVRFFEWYFGDQKVYRFVMFTHDYRAWNIYRNGYSDPEGVIFFDNSNREKISEEETIELMELVVDII